MPGKEAHNPQIARGGKAPRFVFRLCGESTPVLAVEATALSFAAGVISWHLLEQPAIAAGARIAKAPRWLGAQLSRRAPTAQPVGLRGRLETPVASRVAQIDEVQKES